VCEDEWWSESAVAVVADIGTLISRTPEIRGGRPCIAGTGIAVRRIAVWHKMGHSPEEIAANWGYISLAQVHAALAYYYANRAEIDEDLAADDAEAEAFRQSLQQPPAAK
jgi:uncharacterized protein (DUF433 family)